MYKFLKAVHMLGQPCICCWWYPIDVGLGDRLGISTTRSLSLFPISKGFHLCWYLVYGLLLPTPIFITLYLLELNSSSHMLAHSISLSRSSCSLLLSSVIILLIISKLWEEWVCGQRLMYTSYSVSMRIGRHLLMSAILAINSATLAVIQFSPCHLCLITLTNCLFLLYFSSLW